jgi:glutaredoxin
MKEHTDGSESSGVFWDDQISPLDVSERLRNPSQGLAFDEVGLAKKSREYEARQGLGKSKDSRDSPVIRHYHHHFHHGSSEDLVRDVDMSERTQQIAGTKNLPGLGSSFSRSGKNEKSYWTSRKNSLELIQLSSINKVNLV